MQCCASRNQFSKCALSPIRSRRNSSPKNNEGIGEMMQWQRHTRLFIVIDYVRMRVKMEFSMKPINLRLIADCSFDSRAKSKALQLNNAIMGAHTACSIGVCVCLHDKLYCARRVLRLREHEIYTNCYSMTWKIVSIYLERIEHGPQLLNQSCIRQPTFNLLYRVWLCQINKRDGKRENKCSQ